MAETGPLARLRNPPNDWRVNCCGHNFSIAECPYERCDARDGALTERSLIAAWLRNRQDEQGRYPYAALADEIERQGR